MSIRTFIGGVGFGAALLYFLDPKEGERRRTLLRDGAQRALKGAEEAISRAKEQIASQAAAMQGAPGAARGEVPADGSDAALEEQVRAAIAEISSHPAAIDVMVQDGRVELEGTILASERGPLVARLAALPGVLDVGDYLDEVEESDVRTDLQG